MHNLKLPARKFIDVPEDRCWWGYAQLRMCSGADSPTARAAHRIGPSSGVSDKNCCMAGLQLTVSAASFNTFSQHSYTRSLSPPHLPTVHSGLHLQPPRPHISSTRLPSPSSELLGFLFLCLSLWNMLSPQPVRPSLFLLRIPLPVTSSEPHRPPPLGGTISPFFCSRHFE